MMKQNPKLTQTAEEFAADMLELAGTFGPDKEALNECKPLVLAGVQRNFDSASDGGGSKWLPHAPLTIKLHGPHPLLILQNKMRPAAVGTGPGKVERNDGLSLELGVDKGVIPYAGVHQDGYRRIPKRQYLDISPETQDQCLEMIADYAVATLAGAR